jgi:hypothetical protein
MSGGETLGCDVRWSTMSDDHVNGAWSHNDGAIALGTTEGEACAGTWAEKLLADFRRVRQQLQRTLQSISNDLVRAFHALSSGSTSTGPICRLPKLKLTSTHSPYRTRISTSESGPGGSPGRD